jgi:cytoskeletal protein CcmA (bactofilin family)
VSSANQAAKPVVVAEEFMMFKKTEGEYQQPEQPAAVPSPRSNPVEPRREGATIGPSISIKGDLTGEEDLIIQGRVEGRVDLKQNSVTIGRNGRVKADIYGKLVNVEGEVEGNLFGLDQIVVRSTGSVRGNIVAPRVSIEDGARFKGSIDMDSKSGEKPRAAISAETKMPASAGEAVPKAGMAMNMKT